MDWQTNDRPLSDQARATADEPPMVRELPRYDYEHPCPECRARRQATERQELETVSPQQTVIVFDDADDTHAAKVEDSAQTPARTGWIGFRGTP